MEKNPSLVTDPPPPYSEVESDRSPHHIASTGAQGSRLEDQVQISMREIDQTLHRVAPGLKLDQDQKTVIKRLTESLLKRNVREQGVLPTTLQKQFTLEHVILKFDKPSRRAGVGANSTHIPQPNFNELFQSAFSTYGPYTSTNTYFQSVQTSGNTCMASNQWSTNNVNNRPTQVGLVNVEPTPPASESTTASSSQTRAAPTRTRTVIGQWGTYRVNNGPIQVMNAYDSHLPKALVCMVILLVLFFFVGTPLSLFFTVPALYWIVMANKSSENGDMDKTKKYFGKCYCMSIVSITMSFVFFMIIVTVLPVAITLSVSGSR